MATGMSHLKRFIDTLRSLSTIASSSLAENLVRPHLALRHLGNA
jgi:hypothetical protein